jgi:hypothetical protein
VSSSLFYFIFVNFTKENVHALEPMVFWNVMLYSLVHSSQHFGATCYLYLQGSALSHFLNTDSFRVAQFVLVVAQASCLTYAA